MARCLPAPGELERPGLAADVQRLRKDATGEGCRGVPGGDPPEDAEATALPDPDPAPDRIVGGKDEGRVGLASRRGSLDADLGVDRPHAGFHEAEEAPVE